MEALIVLEQKIAVLLESKRHDIESLKKLREESAVLKQENLQLRESLEKLENTVLARHEGLEELAQERASAKSMIDGLIKSIDLIIEAEPHQ